MDNGIQIDLILPIFRISYTYKLPTSLPKVKAASTKQYSAGRYHSVDFSFLSESSSLTLIRSGVKAWKNGRARHEPALEFNTHP